VENGVIKEVFFFWEISVPKDNPVRAHSHLQGVGSFGIPDVSQRISYYSSIHMKQPNNQALPR